MNIHYIAFNKEISKTEAIEQAVAFAKEASQKLPNQVGVLHIYAEGIIEAKESGLMISQEELQEANHIINR
ncbi:hypothetical protein KM915_16865 [Cytobacillus oceanisediminis]|uniref:hypothetical protein n=1 Tax=Cytobacillus oceanisediminis TaxID=665099 RepID=UPI001C24AB60|nr:hypothetical protein [Cytobacillus oceanisediminis]MBU8731726.1 hypothetical protein [Cytobacillus oceanisediminis]